MPDALADAVQILWRPLARRLADLAKAHGRTIVAGLCGPQGSGKSTGAAVLQTLMAETQATSAILSLDDLYLTRPERSRLARDVHPLFAVRGPPGTHDVALGQSVLTALSRKGSVRLPRFDKARDDRADPGDWPDVQGPVDVVLFEGWCMGARPQSALALAPPVNALEAEHDPDGVWRRAANDALVRVYRSLFDRIDFMILLRPPGFDVVAGWRLQQEHALRERTNGGMSDMEVVRFVQHYERLSRWIDEEMPARADVVVQLDEWRRPKAIRGL